MKHTELKKVLILGAGMVAGPIIKYLMHRNLFVSVASNTLDRANELIAHHPNGVAVFWDANDAELLDKLILEHDIVVSLLPYAFHVMVAKNCIKHEKDMVTTSYVKPEMYALDKEAKDAGVVIINECGLDPGIDHMSAKRIIDTVHGLGGEIVDFYSLCGALPAPECSNDNPFRYKFSWSPKGVVLASNNDAKYLKNKKVISVPTVDLFKKPFTLDFPGVETLEVYPNRDSLPYVDIYGIPEVETMFRGTFRYKGWCEALDVLKQLNLTEPVEFDYTGMSYAHMIAKQIGAKSTDKIATKTAKYLKLKMNSPAIKAMGFLGLFGTDDMGRTKDTAYEIVSDLMIEKMMLGKEERDMCALIHVFKASYPDGRQEVIKSRVLDFGVANGETSIARTVALPAACAVKMILDGEISVKGVHIPVIPEIYNPIIYQLENLGIEFIEEYGLPLSEMIK